MPYYYPPPSPDEIYHHGILGQKWGKRNGPPYPLGASDHSAAEKKAGYQKSIDGKSETSSKKKSLMDASKKLQDIRNKYSKKNEELTEELNKKAVSKYGKDLDALYDQAMKESHSMPYNKSTWKKINDLEDEYYDKVRKESDDYYSEIHKLGNNFVEDYIKKYGDMDIDELRSMSTKRKNHEHDDIDYVEIDDLINNTFDTAFDKYYKSGKIKNL